MVANPFSSLGVIVSLCPWVFLAHELATYSVHASELFLKRQDINTSLPYPRNRTSDELETEYYAEQLARRSKQDRRRMMSASTGRGLK